MFLRYLIKVDKGEILKYIFCIFSFTKKISSTFIKESSKLIKENTWTICRVYLCAFVTFCFFPGKLPIYMRSK